MKKILLAFCFFTIGCTTENHKEEVVHNNLSSLETASSELPIDTVQYDPTPYDSKTEYLLGRIIDSLGSQYVGEQRIRHIVEWDYKNGYSNRFLKEYNQEYEEFKYKYRFGTSDNHGYNYDITGEDENGNTFNGNIDIQGKFGSGTIEDEYGVEKAIQVEWVDYGVLTGSDEEGVQYKFRVQ